MISQILASAFVLASFANAHFTIEYPEMRGDSFATGASQYIYPCREPLILFSIIKYILTFSGANVNQTSSTNRTMWPLTGGSLNLDLHHQWTYYFVNLGLGTDYPTFNITLTQQLLNETGNGTLCMPQIVLPAGVTVSDGQNASIQVVTVGQSGSALYNVSNCTISLHWRLYESCLSLSFLSRRCHLLGTPGKNLSLGSSVVLTSIPVCRYHFQQHCYHSR